MGKSKTGNGGIIAQVRVSDGRYPLDIFIDSDGGTIAELHTHFNPGNPRVLRCIKTLMGIQEEYTDGKETAGIDADKLLDDIDALSDAIDTILGGGTAHFIFSYDDYKHSLLRDVLKRVGEGYADYTEKADAAKKEAQTAALTEAKKHGGAYRVNG